MIHSVYGMLLALCWGLFVVVWGVGWIYNLWKAPRVQKRSPLLPVWIIGVALIILVSRIGWLAPLRSLELAGSTPLWMSIIGGACLVLSTGLTLWARFVLGSMWSSEPETKVDHQLRTEGPYRITRHPIYTGIIGMLLGSLLMSGPGVWALPTVIGIAVVLIKVPSEERLMLETFGERYKEYQRRVPQLIPGLQLLRRVTSR